MKTLILHTVEYDCDGTSYNDYLLPVTDYEGGELAPMTTSGIAVFAHSAYGVGFCNRPLDSIESWEIVAGDRTRAGETWESAGCRKGHYEYRPIGTDWKPWAGPNGDDTIGTVLDTTYDE